MRFEKTGQLVFVGERAFMKEGRELKFYDLHLVIEGEGAFKIDVSNEVAAVAKALMGQNVTIDCELQQDRRSSWLYALRVRAIRAAEKVGVLRDRAAG